MAVLGQSLFQDARPTAWPFINASSPWTSEKTDVDESGVFQGLFAAKNWWTPLGVGVGVGSGVGGCTGAAPSVKEKLFVLLFGKVSAAPSTDTPIVGGAVHIQVPVTTIGALEFLVVIQIPDLRHVRAGGPIPQQRHRIAKASRMLRTGSKSAADQTAIHTDSVLRRDLETHPAKHTERDLSGRGAAGDVGQWGVSYKTAGPAQPVTRTSRVRTQSMSSHMLSS